MFRRAPQSDRLAAIVLSNAVAVYRRFDAHTYRNTFANPQDFVKRAFPVSPDALILAATGDRAIYNYWSVLIAADGQILASVTTAGPYTRIGTTSSYSQTTKEWTLRYDRAANAITSIVQTGQATWTVTGATVDANGNLTGNTGTFALTSSTGTRLLSGFRAPDGEHLLYGTIASRGNSFAQDNGITYTAAATSATSVIGGYLVALKLPSASVLAASRGSSGTSLYAPGYFTVDGSEANDLLLTSGSSGGADGNFWIELGREPSGIESPNTANFSLEYQIG